MPRKHVSISVDCLLRLPAGKFQAVVETYDIGGAPVTAVRWQWWDEFGWRESLFDIETGEYVCES